MTFKNEQLKISLIMPVYNSMSAFERGNGRFLLPEAINSILNQSYSNFELLILDNISVDGTIDFCNEAAAKDPRIRVIKDTQRRSPEESIFRLIHLATGEFTAIVNDDDKWDRFFLSSLLETMSEGDFDLVYSNGNYIDIEDRLLEPLINHQDLIYSSETEQFDNFSRYIHNRNPFPISFGLFKSSLLKQTYPELKFHRYKANMDNLFIAQFLLNTNRIKYVESKLFFYRLKTRIYKHDVEFGHDSRMDPNLELMDLLDHHREFCKTVEKSIIESSIQPDLKPLLLTANLNSFINYVLKMFKWQLEKPGLSVKEFRLVSRIQGLLENFLRENLFLASSFSDFSSSCLHLCREDTFQFNAIFSSEEIFNFLDKALEKSPGNFLNDFELLIKSLVITFKNSQGFEFFSSEKEEGASNFHSLFFQIKRTKNRSYLYYRFIKSAKL